MSVSASIRKLHRIRNIYTTETAKEKLDLMGSLSDAPIRKASLLRLFHGSLCFIRAFPDDLRHYRLAIEALGDFLRRVRFLGPDERAALTDTGIEGTRVHYRFSYAAALWMARNCAGSVEIDWDELETGGRFDELLRQVVQPGEADYYASGAVSEQQWLELARGERTITDFRWLMVQLRRRRAEGNTLAAMYDAADVPLRWRADRKFAKGRNALPTAGVVARKHGMRKPRGSTRDEVERPFRRIYLLEKHEGARAISMAVASLAARHRETYHFNHANPREVYDIDIGCGVHILIYGLLPEYRFSLETTMGYLIVANGMPVGYGGASGIFSQANTGINIFEEYRGGEAPYLWIQVLRAYHQGFGCTRFVINPFQLGVGNKEALKSGAFWFYYRLGFRPVESEIARLAVEETAKVKTRKDYRSDVRTLKQLCRCDMHLKLTGARQSEFFPENWLEICAAGAASVLARQAAVDRRVAARQAASGLLETLGAAADGSWTVNERQALLLQAPVMSLVPEIERWSRRDKDELVSLMKAKGAEQERDYIMQMRGHDALRRGLSRYCRTQSG